jgi:hypothetical protein
VQDYLERLHEEYAGMRDGAVADYIPPLADADPDAFGICLATTDGHLYEVGDTRVPFTTSRCPSRHLRPGARRPRARGRDREGRRGAVG